tara:strand:+ start:277 stop:1086 length:810 start_codon:yes stop_codon:yes gene_type:complete
VNLAWLILALPVWGLEPNISLTDVPNRLMVVGRLDGEKWTRQVAGKTEILTFECAPIAGCNSHPSSAVFYFHENALVSGTMQFSREKGPRGEHLTQHIQQQVETFGKPIAVGQVVGRYTRYYSNSTTTTAWVQDGDQAQIKLYVDRLNPMGRAEATAQGAQLSLADYSGASAYKSGYQALLKEDWAAAISSFKSVIENKQAQPIFKDQVQFVLAMSIAASLKGEFKRPKNRTRIWVKTAEMQINQAKTLAPALKIQLDQLLKTFRTEIP